MEFAVIIVGPCSMNAENTGTKEDPLVSIRGCFSSLLVAATLRRDLCTAIVGILVFLRGSFAEKIKLPYE
jgi:hypothetical protein